MDGAHGFAHAAGVRGLLASAMLLLSVPAARAAAPDPIDPLDQGDLSRAAQRLRGRVAYIRATLPLPEGSPFTDPRQVEGWGVVVSDREVRCQAFLVKDEVEIRVEGPEGVVEADLLALDVGLRVARLAPRRSLSSLGLRPSRPSPPEARALDMDVLALVSTQPGAGVVVGVLTALGRAPHLEGNLRSDLELAGGMPVFDTRLRWLGLARAVAWDADRSMLIPPELTEIPTATTAAAAAPPPPDEVSGRPWWAR